MQCSVKGCSANAVKDASDGRCFMHSKDKNIVKRRKEAQSKGGSLKAKKIAKIKINEVDDILEILTEALDEVRRSKTDKVLKKARAIGYVAGIVLKALEKSALEQRIESLEKQISG